MKSLRRSLNNNGNNGVNGTTPYPSPPVSSNAGSSINPIGRPSEKVAPPQKVIKALKSHRSANPQELSYNAGDFWYVTGERDGWYEALNPLVGSRGLVPKDDFEEFAKGGRTVSQSGTSRSNATSRSHTPSFDQSTRSPPFTSPPASVSHQQPKPLKSRQPVYAVVVYDFNAERPDELDARKGESLVIIAQSNHEWFVAKPIGRLGGPGLIPVAFVEIRDLATGASIEVLPDTIPMVEEWKKATADYKAAAIPLGRFDISDAPVQNSPYASQSPSRVDLPNEEYRQYSNGSPASGSFKKPHYRPEQDPHFPPGEFTLLSVPSFHKESGNYWFRLQVSFVPDEPTAPAYSLSLYRTYEDFYDFQISLLDTFPYEAGRPKSDAGEDEVPERILPYMPGPVEDEIDDELTEYRREELDLYVKALVDLKGRGAEYITRHELFRAFFAAKYGDYCEDIPRENAVAELEERLAEVRVDHDRSSSRETGRDDRAPSAASRHSQPSSQWSVGHARQGSSSRNSPLPPAVDTSRPTSSSQGHYLSGGPSTGVSSTTSWSAPAMSATTPGAKGVPNLPGGQQPPYVKIKIYDRSTDDLIALRVHPNVSHADLFDKVRARLGPEINILRYRTSMTGPQGGAYREVGNDDELRSWMRTEDQKLVLYAEQ